MRKGESGSRGGGRGSGKRQNESTGSVKLGERRKRQIASKKGGTTSHGMFAFVKTHLVIG